MKKFFNIRWQLVIYDVLILLLVSLLLLVFSGINLSVQGIIAQSVLSFVCIFAMRLIGNVYGQIWRYGGIQCYIRLITVDAFAFLLDFVLEISLISEKVGFVRLLAFFSINLLGTLTIRMLYRYAFKCGNETTAHRRCLLFLLKVFAGKKIIVERTQDIKKTGIAIIGAGRVGVSLADELLNNVSSAYVPMCFVDVNKEKVGRSIRSIPVLPENDAIFQQLRTMGVQEVILAVSNLGDEKKRALYDCYKNAGYRVKTYDYPVLCIGNNKRRMREFDIEELLFRKPRPIAELLDSTVECYQGKIILVTGGGGSIGSEMCRQLAKMRPKQIIILDICENGAYDVQQDIKIAYKGELDVRIEIMSITNRTALEKVFYTYHPQVVINAAAHKHVPLMEHNCVEAVINNVFGTKNLIDLCEEYDTERFIMVSTDKAVNPTNVMGATKRMCEMLVQCASTYGSVKYCMTRFGNVLGSAGSVIPLFKKQIESGGPVTLTDRRITRYFMTIPEASQLVLASGAMANNGEIFVLDMGSAVKILDLAEDMIRLSGAQGVEIVEIGLRPGEKLYEELLIKTEKLDKTDNNLIFIERDMPLSVVEINRRMDILKNVCLTENDDAVRDALMEVVPTFKKTEEANKSIEKTEEMQNQSELIFA